MSALVILISPLNKVEEATKLAQVYDDIKDMPEGFETIIGEKGVSLSGGQKQRLAMSRAMILDPDILILDDSSICGGRQDRICYY